MRQKLACVSWVLGPSMNLAHNMFVIYLPPRLFLLVLILNSHSFQVNTRIVEQQIYDGPSIYDMRSSKAKL